MNIYFINPPFKAEYGKFSRESRSPAITKSGALYYPLWLIYAALYSSKQGHNVSFLDAPAKQLNEEQSLNIIRKTDNEHSLFVLDTSTINAAETAPATIKQIKNGITLFIANTTNTPP